MKFGVYAPNFGDSFGNPKLLTSLAIEAEESGWDGFFLWDHIVYTDEGYPDMVDPFIALASVADNTEKIHLGTTVTPLSRRRPWKLAHRSMNLNSTKANYIPSDIFSTTNSPRWRGWPSDSWRLTA